MSDKRKKRTRIKLKKVSSRNRLSVFRSAKVDNAPVIIDAVSFKKNLLFFINFP